MVYRSTLIAIRALASDLRVSVIFSCLAATCTSGSASAAGRFPQTSHFTDLSQLEAVPKQFGFREGEIVRPLYGNGLQVTKDAEGWRSIRYLDTSNLCTIGYGHLIKPPHRCNGTEGEFNNPITRQRGEALLQTDMLVARRAVAKLVKVALKDWEYAALCDFAFNVGTGKRGFGGSSLLRVINQRHFEEVPRQLRRWTSGGGKPVKGLVNRRRAEIALFFNGGEPREGLIGQKALPLINVFEGERI